MFPCGIRCNAKTVAAAVSALFTAGLPQLVSAQDQGSNFLGLDLEGSFGEGRHSRYVPPLSNPLFNETPYITTEVRAIYFHQEIPDGFVTNGGDIDLVAVELRVALTDRLGFI
jgi:hypothetical protein